MVFSGMLRRVALVRRATWRNIPEDTILLSHCRENLKSYIVQDILCSSLNVIFSTCLTLCLSNQVSNVVMQFDVDRLLIFTLWYNKSSEVSNDSDAFVVTMSQNAFSSCYDN
jgi:hypothetical protein